MGPLVKVLITDDHPVVRKGIRQILEDEPGIGVIDEAGNGKQMLRMIESTFYDVILLDISFPGESGLDLIPMIKKIQPLTAILILSIHSEKVYAINALKKGASGYLNKSSAPDELVRALFRVAGGNRYLPEGIADLLADAVIYNREKPVLEILSPREREVLILIVHGNSIKVIAEKLNLSSKTISTYRERLLRKLNLSSNADLVRFVLSNEITVL